MVKYDIVLPSLLLLPCIVVLERELANILFPFTINLQNSLQEPFIVLLMNIVINTFKD